jgi:phosphoenolpyruvate carboxykinase (ATP)
MDDIWTSILSNLETEKSIHFHYNLFPSEYYKKSMSSGDNTVISSSGALVCYSGEKTGRSPKYKRIIYDPNDKYNKDIWWNNNNNESPNIPIDIDNYMANRERAIKYLTSQNELYIVDCYAGWDNNNSVKVRLITDTPYHALFIDNMLIPIREYSKYYNIDAVKDFVEPDYVIYNAGNLSDTNINFCMERGEIVILGTMYAGEMKKGIFTIMHCLMPQKGILSLHASANMNHDKTHTALFLGLSGTGKTSLSTDPNRLLIGDDEICWTDNGVFNIEGGCYAKCINLSKENEPDIYNSIKYGALLENVVLNEDFSVNFEDGSITQNTRVSYPISYINNAIIPCLGNHPNDIIFLTCDAFGVLPLVSKLSYEQIMYHFVSGYTAKIAGTEQGIKEPVATFSACFGQAFIMCHPIVYSHLLKQKVEQYDANVWLVNTGWVNGEYGIGERCPISLTRRIVGDIITQKMKALFNDTAVVSTLPFFNLQYLSSYGDDSDQYLDPLKGCKDNDIYLSKLSKLYNMFETNFEKLKKS